MDPVFKKMNFKEQQTVLLLKAPNSFLPIVDAMQTLTEFHFSPAKELHYPFILIFLYQESDISWSAELIKHHLGEDCLFWLAYPKKSSKKYTTDLSRNSNWQPIGDLGYEGVRQVAIDEDWSALRFRDARFIKSMKRKKLSAMSEEGKKKIQN